MSQKPPAEKLDSLKNISANPTGFMAFEVTASVSILTTTTNDAAGNETVRDQRALANVLMVTCFLPFNLCS